MKTAIIPAEVTSMEDTIAANLNLSQVILLTIPIFINVFVFVVLPPEMHLDAYKLIISLILSLPFFTLAIRIKQRMVLSWAILASGYILRPHKYLLTQPNLDRCTCNNQIKLDVINDSKMALPISRTKIQALKPAEVVVVKRYLNHKDVKYFTNKEGILNAYFETK